MVGLMSNSTAKGNQHELEVKHYLEAEGWSVFRVHKKAMFLRDARTNKPRMVLVGADAFGCDLICKKKGELPRWIQVGADGSKAKKEDQLNEHVWDTNHERVEIWLRLEGKKAYRVYVLKPVDVLAGGQGQSFSDCGLVQVGHSAAATRARLLPGGAGFVR